jgi:hypothetical protein
MNDNCGANGTTGSLNQPTDVAAAIDLHSEMEIRYGDFPL